MVFETKKLFIYILSNNSVRLVNKRENGKVYHFNKFQFYQLIKYGVGQITSDRSNEHLTLLCNISGHPGGKHLYSIHNIINTYIPLDTYYSLIRSLENGFSKIERVKFKEKR